MNPVFEYIIVTAIVILLVGWTFITMSSSTLVAINRLDDERINVVAGEVFNNLLLTPGDPVNWTTSNVKSLGLAKINTTETFDLDREKVLSLKNGSIDINKARSLLGIQNLYDFSLSITPALNIAVMSITYNAARRIHSFDVLVKDLNGLPVSMSMVEGYYVNNTGKWNVGDPFAYNSSLTKIDGHATLNFASSTNPRNVTLLITVKSSTAQYNAIFAKTCYIKDSSVSSCGLSGQPQKTLRIDGKYVVEGLPQIDAFTVPSTEPPGGLKTVSLSLYVDIDSYTYEATFRFWRVSQ